MVQSDERTASLNVLGQYKNKALIFVVISVTIVLIGFLMARRPHDQIQGMVETDEIRIAPKISGRVVGLHALEGQRVELGQPLYTLTSADLEAQLAQMRAKLSSAESQMDKMDKGSRAEDIRTAGAKLEAAKAAAEFQTKNYQRLEALYKTGSIAAHNYDNAAALYKAALQEAEAAKSEYEKALTGYREEDKQAARALVMEAEGYMAQIGALEAELRQASPISGEISKRLVNIGELVPAGYPAYTLFDPENMWVALNVREDQFHGLDRGRIFKGDIPALDLKEVEFEVYYITPLGEFATWRATRQSKGYDIKTFEVRVRAKEKVTGLRPGMSVLFLWPQG